MDSSVQIALEQALAFIGFNHEDLSRGTNLKTEPVERNVMNTNEPLHFSTMDKKDSSGLTGTQLQVESISERDEWADRGALFVKNVIDEYGDIPPLSLEEERSMLRSFDLRVVPLITISITMASVDKVSVGTAAIYGLQADTHLVGQQYSWVSSGIFIGCIVAALPHMYLMKRFTTNRYIAVNVFMWGLCTMCMAACSNFAGLMALRILLGVFESTMFSAMLLVLSSFYKRSEQPTRTAICFSTFSSVIVGLISFFSSFALDNGRTLAPWKIIFLSLGSFSCFLSILNWFFLPSTPIDFRWLQTDIHRAQALIRINDDKLGTENHVIKWYQVWEAFVDPKTWLIFVCSALDSLPNNSATSFSSIIIEGLGYSSRVTSLLSIPTGVITFVSSFIFAWIAGKTRRYRTVVAAISCIPPLIGTIAMKVLPQDNRRGRLAGVYILYTFWSPYLLGQAIINNTSGTTKKVTVYAINYVAYSIGNLVGPQTFRADEAPGYKTATTTIICCYIVCAACFLVYGRYCRCLNSRKEKELAKSDSRYSEVDDVTLTDLTDLENPYFVYIT